MQIIKYFYGKLCFTVVNIKIPLEIELTIRSKIFCMKILNFLMGTYVSKLSMGTLAFVIINYGIPIGNL